MQLDCSGANGKSIDGPRITKGHFWQNSNYHALIRTRKHLIGAGVICVIVSSQEEHRLEYDNKVRNTFFVSEAFRTDILEHRLNKIVRSISR